MDSRKKPTHRGGSRNKKEVKMTKVYIYDAITGKDITPYVTLKVGKGGFFHVFNSLGVDITENIYFVTD